MLETPERKREREKKGPWVDVICLCPAALIFKKTTPNETIHAIWHLKKTQKNIAFLPRVRDRKKNSCFKWNCFLRKNTTGLEWWKPIISDTSKAICYTTYSSFSPFFKGSYIAISDLSLRIFCKKNGRKRNFYHYLARVLPSCHQQRQNLFFPSLH